jgi:uncharacterized phage protein (TIGR02220 family)
MLKINNSKQAYTIMAEGKKSFVLYADYIHTAENLPDDVAGRLYKTILRYVNDQSPAIEELVLKVAFEPIKQQLKRDLKEWEKTLEDKSNSGRIGNLKRWNKDLYEKVSQKQLTLEAAEIIAESRRGSHSDKSDTVATKPIANIAVNDTVTVNVNDIYNNVVLAFERVTGKKNIKLNDSRKNLINGRLKEGYKLEDFEKVFKVKNAEWKNNNDMKKYLTLETLLQASKFTKYLEQGETVESNSLDKPHY